jgi:predicted MFS family arabinose efflux permease
MLVWPGWFAALQISRSEGIASWHVLRQRRFRRYFVGSLISNLGTWLQNTAQVLLAYQLTHSAFAVGMVACAQFSSSLFLGPWAASLTDRLDARRLLIGTQLFSACIAAGIAGLKFAGLLGEKPLILGAMGLGLAFTFALPVQTAMVPRLVREADTEAAMAMNSVSYNAGRAIAPALCVGLAAAFGLGWAFALNAGSFVVFAAALFLIRPDSVAQRAHSDGVSLPAHADGVPVPPHADGLALPGQPHGGPQSARRPRYWISVRIAVQRPRIMLLLAMVAALTVAEDPILVLGPSLAREMHALSSVWPGFFLSALGAGTVLGASLPTRQLTSVKSASKRAAGGLLVLAFSMIIFTGGLTVWISLFAALVAGVAGLLTGSATQSLLWRLAGPQLAAKVMALWAIAWAGSKPLASLADGWLAGTVGIRWTGLVLAAPALAVAVLELSLSTTAKDWLKRRMAIHNASRVVI